MSWDEQLFLVPVGVDRIHEARVTRIAWEPTELASDHEDEREWGGRLS